MTPNGIPLWVSEVLPGSVHDLTAVRELVLAIVWPHAKTMPVLADSGYEGAGCGVLAPIKRRTDGIPPRADQRSYNRPGPHSSSPTSNAV